VIALAESNFVLELALQQEEFDHAQRILQLAEEARIQLVIPACSLQEPYQTLLRRRSERKELSRKLQAELKLVARSKSYEELSRTSEQVAQTLDASTTTEADALESTIERLVKICKVPELSKQVIKLAQGVQIAYGLDPHDALVFASIDLALRELGDEPKVFANKNSKDFATPLIEDYLAKYQCRLITSFGLARGVIEGELARPSS
jgi:predicted nucleic acid-binding protein